MGNTIKTVALLGLLTGIILFIGSFWGRGGITIALVLCVAMNFASYFFSDKIALSMYHARQVTRAEAPQIYRSLDYICGRNGLPLPAVYIIPDESPNAFATGRNPAHASVAVTQGALRLLDTNELAGVLAHEMAHVQNRDILISSVAATLAGVIMWVASMAKWAALFGMGRSDDDNRGGGLLGSLAMIIVAPLAATLIQMWISRTREFAADAGAAACVGPQGLVSALRKLEACARRIPMHATPNTAHMMIMQPFSGKTLMNLFSTHPPTEKRIERLQAVGGASGRI